MYFVSISIRMFETALWKNLEFDCLYFAKRNKSTGDG